MTAIRSKRAPLLLETDSIVLRPPVGSLADARHELFAREYIRDCNTRRAAVVAGYSPETAVTIGQNLLLEPDVIARIDALIVERRHQLKADAGQVISQLLTIATFDVRSLYDDRGELLPVHLWPPEAGQVVASMEITDVSGDDEAGFSITKKVKLVDKSKALEMLGKHLGMFVDRLHVTGNVEVRNLDNKELDSRLSQLLQKQARTIDVDATDLGQVTDAQVKAAK